MLGRFAARGFKSLRDLEVELCPFSVFVGPNAAGASNLLEAVRVFGRVGTERTLGAAMDGAARGFPIEAFSFPPGGFPEILSSPSARFEFDADLTTTRGHRYRYAVSVEIDCRSGALSAGAEHLVPLSADGAPGRSPVIETEAERLPVRQRGARRPRREPVGRPFTALSDRRLTAPDHAHLERVRDALGDWRAYSLDPRDAMRTRRPLMDIEDLGGDGRYLAPYLFRLRHEFPRQFDAVRRTLRTLVDGIEELEVEPNAASGELELWFRQDGIRCSSRVVSDGTLRLLALVILAVDPWAGSLVALEEPAAGIHPRQVETVFDLLFSLTAEKGRQVLVATHSPLFCNAVLSRARENPGDIGLFAVGRQDGATRVRRLDLTLPLFRDPEIRRTLTTMEDGFFESLLLGGHLEH